MPAKTEKQRKLFGAALACRKNGKCKGGAAEIAKGTVATKEIEKMASKESVDSKKKNVVQESVDKIHISNFIDHICKKDFAEASKSLELAIREKTKMLIQNASKEID
jgi:hypothetical protein